MSSSSRFILIIICFLLAVGLFTVNSEREFIRYLPQEGERFNVVLASGVDYQQTFTVTRRTISRLGIFLRPATDLPLPAQSMRVTISSPVSLLARVDVPVSFIDDEGATQIRLPAPIATQPGESITFNLSVPPALSGQLRAQFINPEDSPPASKLSFFINGDQPSRPLAFQVYYGYRPPLAVQGALLFLFLAAWLILNRPLLRPLTIFFYTLTSAAAYLSPAAVIGYFSWPLTVAFILALVGMILLLRSYSLPPSAVLLGANAFAFSTYFALHDQVGRDRLLVISFLPLLIYLCQNRANRRSRLFYFALALIGATLFLWLVPYYAPSTSPTLVANLPDILLDPNQIPATDNFSASYYALQIPTAAPDSITHAGGWDNVGSYLGVINLSLAIIGLAFYPTSPKASGVSPRMKANGVPREAPEERSGVGAFGYAGFRSPRSSAAPCCGRGHGRQPVELHCRRFWPVVITGLLGWLISASPFLTPHLISRSFLPPQYFIFLTSFSLAFFAAFGLAKLRSFLGLSRLTQFIIVSLTIFALLDLLNVTSKTLQFGLL